MYKYTLAIILVVAISSCQPQPQYRLKTLVDVDAIDAITIHNNSGDYKLNSKELSRFRQILGNMHYRPEASLKMGSTGFSIHLHGKGYYAASRTHDQYVELPKSMVSPPKYELLAKGDRISNSTLFFEFDSPVNLDNYHKKP